MDQRVTDLWDQIMSRGQTGEPMPLVDWRNEVLKLHAAIADEESRIGLMRIFNLICDLMASHLKQTGRDVAPLELDRRDQIWKFLRAESLKATDVPHPLTLLYVTAREIIAGRMTEDDPMRLYALFLMAKWEDFLAQSQPEEAERRSVH